MRIIELSALPNGAHRNQYGAPFCPEGWAVLPPEVAVPDSFPFVSVAAENGVITLLEPIPVPDPDPEPEQIDMAQRITELEDAILELAEIIGGAE